MSRHSLRIGKQSWGVGGWTAFLALSHLCRHLRCPARQALATGGSSSSHLSHLRSLRKTCRDSWLARLAGWMNELKWRVSEWVPGGSCGWAAALGQGRAGLGAVQAKPRQLWGLGGRDPQLGKAGKSRQPAAHPRLNGGITRQDFCSTLCKLVSQPRVSQPNWRKKISSHPWVRTNDAVGMATGSLLGCLETGKTIVSDLSP